LKSTKDYGLLIFHGLGKFLYNKRIDPFDGKPKFPDFFGVEAMTDPATRPKSYFRHEDVLN
jgi:hypothetical protein